jgi:SAM-dependent methyltransferase
LREAETNASGFASKLSRKMSEQDQIIRRIEQGLAERIQWALQVAEEIKQDDSQIAELPEQCEECAPLLAKLQMVTKRSNNLSFDLNGCLHHFALAFRCNLCGAVCRCPLAALGRETASCPNCKSSARMRAVIDILSQKLLGESMPLWEIPENKSLRGIGMTDSTTYAPGLAKKFDYQNTYLDCEPRLDITGELSNERKGVYDFVISSEVFEHVLPPVRRAFENVFQLLKAGGLFVLTVPFGIYPETIEHFPDVYEFKIEQRNGKYIAINITRDGRVQTFHNLVFHGGPGQTLEMRAFSERDVIRHLQAAGFSHIEVHREVCLEYGIWWPEPWSLPITAVR